MMDMPTIDVSTPAAAKKSLREFDRWCASTGRTYKDVRLAIDNMRMAAAHKSEAVKAIAREKIDALLAATNIEQQSGMRVDPAWLDRGR